MTLFWTLLIALSPDGTQAIPLDYKPSAQLCGEALLTYDTSTAWSYHCIQTSLLSASPRPRPRPTREEISK